MSLIKQQQQQTKPEYKINLEKRSLTIKELKNISGGLPYSGWW